MSSERLTRLHDGMQQLVDDGRLAGITTMVARRGRVVDFQTYGQRDIEAGSPMQEDAIFRIYSMSKPITGVALMTLYEEGKFRLSDPVQRYIPEFTDLKVAASWGADGPVLEDADHPMTIRELMSHTAGLAYGIGAPGPTDRLYATEGVLSRQQTLKDMIVKLGAMPLRHQPGTLWYYSIAVDVQGYLVEVLSGQPFDEYLQERVFGPLRMVDTGFHVPEEDHDRLAQYYGYDQDGNLTAPANSGTVGSRAFLDPTTFFSGGGGLVSTMADYHRFCRMLLNGGLSDGDRLLGPRTLALMMRNHLPGGADLSAVGDPLYHQGFFDGVGFGLGFAVVLDAAAGRIHATEGECSWGGMASTAFWVDPVEDLVVIFLTQLLPSRAYDFRAQLRSIVYGSIID